MSTMRVVPKAVRMVTMPRMCAGDRADDRGLARPADAGAWRRARRPRHRARRSPPACLRWRRRAGRARAARRRRARRRGSGWPLRRAAMPTPDCAAISFSVLARPPRVGSRRQRISVRDGEHGRAPACAAAAESLSSAALELQPFALRRGSRCRDRRCVPLRDHASPGRALAGGEVHAVGAPGRCRWC